MVLTDTQKKGAFIGGVALILLIAALVYYFKVVKPKKQTPIDRGANAVESTNEPLGTVNGTTIIPNKPAPAQPVAVMPLAPDAPINTGAQPVQVGLGGSTAMPVLDPNAPLADTQTGSRG